MIYLYYDLGKNGLQDDYKIGNAPMLQKKEIGASQIDFQALKHHDRRGKQKNRGAIIIIKVARIQ